MSEAAIEDFVVMAAHVNVDSKILAKKGKLNEGEAAEKVMDSYFTPELIEIIKVLFKLGKLPEALVKCRDAYQVMMKSEVRKVRNTWLNFSFTEQCILKHVISEHKMTPDSMSASNIRYEDKVKEMPITGFLELLKLLRVVLKIVCKTARNLRSKILSIVATSDSLPLLMCEENISRESIISNRVGSEESSEQASDSTSEKVVSTSSEEKSTGVLHVNFFLNSERNQNNAQSTSQQI